MIDNLIVWSNDYRKRAKEVIDILIYHHILPEDSLRAEGRIQAIEDVLKFIEDKKTIECCRHCTGMPLVDREPLMCSQTSDYSVFINRCNYLEDSIVGGSAPHSLYGVKINFCPVCGRTL
ncbi:hypothetical protein ACH6EH_07140 [Paenibacillus sp. JSM ZJ436]|uniref:hypothetical protein n=1 Tax=Paenibacillus sp. JSM ZJ436 TaxID=3376190 RepID=UPI0037A82353